MIIGLSGKLREPGEKMIYSFALPQNMIYVITQRQQHFNDVTH